MTRTTSPLRTLAWTLASGALLGSMACPVAAQAPTPRMIDVDGDSMRVTTAGFEHLARGQPAVVLESGAGVSIGNWGPVVPAVAAFAPVVAYERAGVGASEWDGQPPTPVRVTDRLRALLAELEAPPPYVLVGHSWGGYLIRHFAGRHPEEVAGLVYVDPTDFTGDRSEELAALREIGVADAETALEAMDQAYTFYASKNPPAIAAEYAVIDSLMKMEPDDRSLLPVPDVPTAVLLRVRYREPPPRPPGIEFGFEYRDLFEARTRQRVRKMSAWALEAPQGLFVLTTHASHNVHREDPDLVIDAIRRVVFPDVALQLREVLVEGGREAMADAYRELKQRYPPERFNEDLLNALGYELLGAGQVDDAIGVFELNVEVYPNAPNPYDSLGDAYRAAGRLEEAKRKYERAVALAEEKGHPSLATYRAHLEAVAQELREKGSQPRLFPAVEPDDAGRNEVAPDVRNASPPDTSEVLKLNRQILRRMIEEQDPGRLQEVALDDYVVVAPGGRVESLEQAVSGADSFSSDATIEVTDERVVRHGETAVVVGKLVIDGEMQPVGTLPPMKFMAVFVRSEGRWRLLSRAVTPCFEIAIERGVC